MGNFGCNCYTQSFSSEKVFLVRESPSFFFKKWLAQLSSIPCRDREQVFEACIKGKRFTKAKRGFWESVTMRCYNALGLKIAWSHIFSPRICGLVKNPSFIKINYAFNFSLWGLKNSHTKEKKRNSTMFPTLLWYIYRPKYTLESNAIFIIL